MKFKIGDKVKVVKRLPGNTTGLMDWTSSTGDVGKVGYINALHKSTNKYAVYIEVRNTDMSRSNYIGVFSDEELELVNDAKKRYKLIKEYPGSFELGKEVEFSTYNLYKCKDNKFIHKKHVEEHPEYWEEITNTLKEGDWVVIDIVEDKIKRIKSIDDCGSFPINFVGGGAWELEGGIRLATEEEVLEHLIKKSGLAVGDRIQVINSDDPKGRYYETEKTFTNTMKFWKSEKRKIKRFSIIDNELYLANSGSFQEIWVKASLVTKLKTVKVGEYEAILVDGKVKIGCQEYSKEYIEVVLDVLSNLKDSYITARGVKVDTNLLKELLTLFPNN